jgi:hypothetical protein
VSKAIAEIAIGVAVVAAAFLAPGLSVALIAALASTGGGLVLTGIGTLLTKQQTGLGTNVRNPIQPHNVVYGDARIGGAVVFILNTGESDKFLHLVYVLACHPCEQVSAILFDGKRVILAWDGSLTTGNSFTPTQWTSSIASIARANNLVTVTLSTPFVGLEDGDFVAITGVSDSTMNGTFPVTVIDSSTFTFLSGGLDSTGSGGQAETTWPDYGDTIHAEVALGTQTSNPFPGLQFGTDGDPDTSSNGLWTSAHALRGKTAIYLRLKFGGDTYQSGMPTIAFVVRGKNDIYDPRTGTRGFTANAALCIADYLTNATWGFKADYDTSVPTGPLITSANICDEAVARASGVIEPRYTCNGSFQLSAKRSEILQNLLTSCAGRLTYTAGLFIIYPAAWIGPAGMFGKTITSAVLSVVTTHILGTGYEASAQATTGTIGLLSFEGPGFIYDSSAWTKRTDTTAIAGDPRSAHVLFGISGSLSGTASPPQQFLVYDAWIDVTYFDSSTAVFRPTIAAVIPNGSGTVTNEANAIDTDPNSAATVSRVTFSPLGDSPYLRISGFALYSGDDGTSEGQSPVEIPAPLSLAAGPFQWKPKLGMRDLFNGVKATYISPSNNWQATDMPPYAQDVNHGYESDANLAADGGDRRWLDIQLPFTNSVSMAQRIAKIELLRRRQQGAGTFVFNLAMFRLTALDVVSLDLSFFSWSGKLLEITGHRFVPNKVATDSGSATTLHTEIDVQETDSTIYDWSTSEELAAGGAIVTLGPSTVTAPTGATATSGSGVAANVGGQQQARVQITWTPSTDAYVQNGGYTVVQYQVTGSSTWTALGNYDPTTTAAYIDGVSDGTSYTARIAYMSTQGIQSDWTVLSPVVASGSTGMHLVYNETPSGTINGTNVTFTLAHAPSPVNALKLYLNGYQLVYGVDYTLSGATITFVNTVPKVGDTIMADYKY